MKIEDKINKIKFDEIELKNLLNEMNNILDSIQISSIKTISEKIEHFNKLRDHYLTLYWCSYLGYLKNITEDKYLKSESIFGKIDPIYNNLIYKYYQILSDLNKNEELVKELGKRTFCIALNQRILLKDENLKLQEKEAELKREYRKIIMGTKFDFEGSVINLSQLNKYLVSNNRDLRKKAYDKRFDILIQISDKLNEIVSSLIQIRTTIAHNLGFSSYKDYGFIKMNRIDYGEEDLNEFKKNVKLYLVPIIEKLKILQTKRLNLKKLEYYDESVLFKDGNAQIKLSLEEVIETLKNIYRQTNTEVFELFETLLKEGLIDLENRENKSSGGLTTFLPDYNMPTFIKKYEGLEANFTSIIHELGHCIQLYFSKSLKYHENRWPTFDICEIHSTANELLIYPYIELFFADDSEKYFIRHLTSLLNIVVGQCAMNDFQNFIYENPHVTQEERNGKWKEITNEYKMSLYNLDYYNKGISWQTDINRIDDPFYGIDYALATICALSFYEELDNPKNAYNHFVSLCKDGGSLSFKELIEKHQLRSPFKEEDIKILSKIITRKVFSE